MKIYYSYMYFYVIIFVNKLLRNFIKAVHQNMFLTQNTQNAACKYYVLCRYTLDKVPRMWYYIMRHKSTKQYADVVESADTLA